MTEKPIPEMTDEELDEYVARLLEEPAFRGTGTHNLSSILKANPDFPTIARRNYAERMERVRQFEAVLAPVIAELHIHDIPATTDDHLDYIAPDEYERAIPILVKWLPRIEHSNAKEWIARCLTVRMARPYVPEFIAEFRRLRDQEKNYGRWAVGNAIGFQIDAELADDILALAADAGYGWDRCSIVSELWRLKGDERVFPLLVDLLDADDYIDAWALQALRHLADPRARPHFERLLDHPDSQYRKYAKKGIAKLDRLQAKAEGRTLPKPVKRPRPARAERPKRPWPSGLPHNGLVALILNDLIKLESLAGASRAALLDVPGIGPATIARIEQELAEKGLAPLSD